MRRIALIFVGLASCVTLLGLAAQPASSEGLAEPGSSAAARLLRTVEDVEVSLRVTRYQARTEVDRAAGRFYWDCSGMVGWLLHRAAPGAFRALGRPRPVAADFHRVLSRAPLTSHGPWRRIADVADARPGDIAAWRTPRDLGATGHVVVFLDAPRRSVIHPRRWLVRIADSTRIPHWDDSRRDPAGGYGTGVMSFDTDARGRIVAWGWLGPLGPHLTGHVAVGRPLR